MTPEQLFERQQKEFEEKENKLFTRGGLAVLLDYLPHDMVLDETEVKSFLSQCQQGWLSHRTSDAEKLIEGVRKMKYEDEDSNEGIPKHQKRLINGFLSAVEQLIKNHYGIK